MIEVNELYLDYNKKNEGTKEEEKISKQKEKQGKTHPLSKAGQ